MKRSELKQIIQETIKDLQEQGISPGSPVGVVPMPSCCEAIQQLKQVIPYEHKQLYLNALASCDCNQNPNPGMPVSSMGPVSLVPNPGE